MSHFTVLVCLPSETDFDKINEAIDKVMAPWDETQRVEPYRSYEEGSPADFWWVGSVRDGAASHKALQEKGAGVLAEERLRKHVEGDLSPEDIGRGTTAVLEKAREWADDARWAVRLGVDPTSDGRIPVTWETVVRLYNEKYHPTTALAEPGDDRDPNLDGRLFYDEETDRAYTLTNYNPNSKWDWWTIGGRWRNYFTACRGVDRNALITSVRARNPFLANDDEDDGPDRAESGAWFCDGGQRMLLDFHAMREEKAREANEKYDKWEDLRSRTQDIESWDDLRSLADVGELTIDEARKRYNSQERVRRAAEEQLVHFFSEPVEVLFGTSREEYVERERQNAVPGYALVTLDGQWQAPGKMGWFGMGSDEASTREAYHVAANAYLDQLDPNAYVVLVDCHI